jgi:eukaryotic-like serine/threonine-protein kinase
VRAPRVLIIDDSPDFRLLARQFILVEWREAVVESFDPTRRTAPAPDFDWNRYDVVLLDYMLGRDDGLEWLRRIREQENSPPVIFLTGAGNEKIAVQALKAGASDYISKHDLSRARLTEAITDVIRERQELEENRAIIARAIEACEAGSRTRTSTDELRGTFKTTSKRDGVVNNVGIAGHRVLRKIGEGGMSTVYLAERTADKQKIVLKLLDSELSHDGDFLRRFIQEYGLISKIHHRGVVRIFDQGFSDEHVYIAMEYFAEGDLKRRIDHGLEVSEAMAIMLQLAEALEAIHLEGVVHRDLKPQNIMFRDDTSLAILDFGIAKLVSSETQLTEHGQVFGTPYYMSPEQGSGQTVDGRSDLYSAGVILYEMLTGRRMYTADNAVSLVYRHIHDDIPKLPKPLARYQPLLERIVAKRPEDRFKDARALIAALQENLYALH